MATKEMWAVCFCDKFKPSCSSISVHPLAWETDCRKDPGPLVTVFLGVSLGSLRYRFLRRQVRWSAIPISKSFPQFVMIHIVKGFSVVNETEVDDFLEFPCFLYDPANVGNLISGSSAFSEPSLNI